MVSSNHLRNEETMMDVAERHLRELASRSMVQVKIDNFSMVRRIESCNLHDLMRDLCLNKGKEERFSETFDKEDDHEGTCSFSERDAYRLAICCRVGKFDDLRLEQITKKYLRAVFVRDAILQGPPNFKSCRVVDFENCSFHEGKLPKEISKMVHLRYLGVKRCRLVELPSAIAGLQYIETLDLRTYSILNLPHNIFLKMKGLRHLYFSGFVRSGSKKLRLNGLSRLETLVGFDSERFRHKDLSEMVNIQYFDAKLGSDDWSVIIDHIDSWTKIKWVKIVISQVMLEQNHIGKLLNCQHLNDLEVLESPICKLPQYESRFWPSLIRLCLSRTEIDEDSMEFLKKLPKLQELVLDCYAFIGKEFICDPTDFHQLKSLRLDTLPNLEKWRMGNGALTNLSSLVIDNCMKLKIIPQDRLRYLRKLKELEIIHMPEEFRQQVWEAS